MKSSGLGPMPYTVTVTYFACTERPFSHPITFVAGCKRICSSRLIYQYDDFSMNTVNALLRSKFTAVKDQIICVEQNEGYAKDCCASLNTVPLYLPLAVNGKFICAKNVENRMEEDALIFLKENWSVEEGLITPLNIVFPMTDDRKDVAGILNLDENNLLHMTHYNQWRADLYGGPWLE